jgi:hypothetical protein
VLAKKESERKIAERIIDNNGGGVLLLSMTFLVRKIKKVHHRVHLIV